MTPDLRGVLQKERIDSLLVKQNTAGASLPRLFMPVVLAWIPSTDSFEPLSIQPACQNTVFILLL